MEQRIYDLIAGFLLLFVPKGRERLPGAEAVDWRNGYFTKDRTDLPYPPPRRLRVVR